MPNKKLKCRHCGEYFDRETMVKVPLGYFCSFDHATKHGQDKGRKAKEKEERKRHREQKEQLKPIGKLKEEAQAAFNKYIRVRDAKLRCVSCGRDTGAKMNAGHYRSVGSTPELRFNTWNCHKQCEHCNSHKSGNIGEYRPRLIEKIGLERVEWIEGPHEASRYRADDFRRIKSIFNKRARLYERLFR